MSQMEFTDAEALDLTTASDDQLSDAWHVYAGRISFHHADDTGSEWGRAKALMPRARAIEVEMRNRGLARPAGDYLISFDDRIDWETGQWSAGWHYRKLRGEANG